MVIFIVILASAVFLAGATILAIVVAGIRAEERHMTLTCAPERPRTLAGAVSRRILGVYARRPQKAPHPEDDSARITSAGGR